MNYNNNKSNNSDVSAGLLQGKLMTVSSSPHVGSSEKTHIIMVDVIIAMTPALIWAVYIFGLRVLSLTLISVASCLLFEALYQLALHKPVTISDMSAAVTGILIAFNLPVNAPLWIPIAGSAFAIIIVKQLFGGVGKNMVNPAIAARIFLFISFPKFLSSYYDIAQEKISPFAIQPNFDEIIGATPLKYLKSGELPESNGISVLDMFLGQIGGCIGEVSAVLLIAGGVYLIIRRVITWHIPVSFIGVVAIITYLLPKNANSVSFCLSELLSGGLLLGAFFMATDYVTCPITKKGKLIFGVGCGLITVFIRYYGGYPEGVSFAIMIMNLFVWYIDKFTKPVKFGGNGGGKKQKQE